MALVALSGPSWSALVFQRTTYSQANRKQLNPKFLHWACNGSGGTLCNEITFGSDLARQQPWPNVRQSGLRPNKRANRRWNSGCGAFRNIWARNFELKAHCPDYAKDAPSLPELVLGGDRAGSPVYDNLLLILEKPKINMEPVSIRFRSGNVYALAQSVTDSGDTQTC